MMRWIAFTRDVVTINCRAIRKDKMPLNASNSSAKPAPNKSLRSTFSMVCRQDCIEYRNFCHRGRGATHRSLTTYCLLLSFERQHLERRRDSSDKTQRRKDAKDSLDLTEGNKVN